ncbi:pentapeptide repeat-containing protein [Yersinia enterocolitica]|nr:pentapeptide repeat-containing protein [Yersinia enterocolitica]EKN3794803.1 pentapeptide repeat-containing protein [Yersinia enterocolitica]EKN3876004.1 pentapeptide repeat-containing protein [Yersinia enterocolitica]EKN4173532.1 pentapeptide repeat-containing protein [Yersinia enterocolitica]ELY5227083.1 pentapeptide repeat-containing protein [Yersinia enterocolitica]
MNLTDLNKILGEHKIWIESYRKNGSRANLYGANLRDANLYGANLYGANLRDANLYGANLRDANLYGANLRDANLRDADLRGANLRDADLRGANLRDANLCDANLCDANLYGANLCDANLRDANLRGADLCGANLPDRTYVIMGEKYYLQISNGENVRAGCQNHTAEEWRKFSKRDIANMDGKTALKFYPRLLDIIDFYLGKGERPEWLNEPDEEVEAD